MKRGKSVEGESERTERRQGSRNRKGLVSDDAKNTCDGQIRQGPLDRREWFIFI